MSISVFVTTLVLLLVFAGIRCAVRFAAFIEERRGEYVDKFFENADRLAAEPETPVGLLDHIQELAETLDNKRLARFLAFIPLPEERSTKGGIQETLTQEFPGISESQVKLFQETAKAWIGAVLSSSVFSSGVVCLRFGCRLIKNKWAVQKNEKTETEKDSVELDPEAAMHYARQHNWLKAA